jgi:diketogulonate reductase-like aldo/keto reductase
MIVMIQHLINRRRFGAAIGASLPAASAMLSLPARAEDIASPRASKPRTVKFPDGRIVPALGQGSWHLAQERHPQLVEEQALRTGLDLGLTVIDTAGNYGDGATEELIGHVIAGQRDKVFLVSKVESDSIFVDGPEAVARSCEASLRRLNTDYLDLYLLHAPVSAKLLPGTVAKFEQLRAAGKIRSWGVSNFDIAQMEELFRVPDGKNCAANEVRYSLRYGYAEHDVIPWCAAHGMPVIAYSPLGGADNLLVNDRALAELGAKHGCSASAIALAWAIRSGNVIAIPEAGQPSHVKENTVALTI